MIRRIAVVVPAANEERRIARCLNSLAAARSHLHRTNAGIQAEVFVVLDSCSDATAEIVRRFAGVHTLAVAARNVGAARRAGARAAIAGDVLPGDLWLASTDADSAVPADWLTVMAAEGHDGHLVLGTVLPGSALSPAIRAEWGRRHHLRENHPHVHGANMGIRGDAYLGLGGWRPLATGEDIDLAARAAQAGHLRITRTAAIPVVTSTRTAGRAPSGFSSYLRNLGHRPLGSQPAGRDRQQVPASSGLTGAGPGLR